MVLFLWIYIGSTVALSKVQQLAFGNHSYFAPDKPGRFKLVGGHGPFGTTGLLSRDMEGGWIFIPSWISQNPVLLCRSFSYLLKVDLKQQIRHLELLGLLTLLMKLRLR